MALLVLIGMNLLQLGREFELFLNMGLRAVALGPLRVQSNATCKADGRDGAALSTVDRKFCLKGTTGSCFYEFEYANKTMAMSIANWLLWFLNRKQTSADDLQQ